jgi:hypothetical protein
MMAKDIEKRLRQALETPRKLNVEQLTARVMNRLREEKRRETEASFIRRFFFSVRSPFALSPRVLMRVSLAAALVIAVIGLLLGVIPRQDFRKISPVSSLAHLDYGPSVPPGANVAQLRVETDPKTILLTQEAHLVSDDPLLRPHSIWQQKTL